MRVLIVDDEPAARQRLVRLMDGLDTEIVGEAGDGLEALTLAEKLRPDVVLLDIEMPEVSGLDVARRLSEPAPLVIFQTAYDRYALDAFAREALDYLVKPVARERLVEALARVRRRMLERGDAGRVTAEVAARIDAVFPPRRPRRLLVRYQAGHRLIAVLEIDRFVARDGLTYALTRQGEHVVDDSLDEMGRRLSGAFVRTSRADLVAIDRVDRVVSTGDGGATLTLKDGTLVHVSRRRAADVRRSLER